MNRYQIWDTPSSTLLFESEKLQDTADELQGVIESGGRDILNDISLSIKDIDDGRIRLYEGESVERALQELLTLEGAPHQS